MATTIYSKEHRMLVERLKKARKEAGLDQVAAAKFCGVVLLALGDEPRKIFQELSQIKLTDVILPTRNGEEIRLRCVETPSHHQGILLQHLKLNLPKRFMKRNL